MTTPTVTALYIYPVKSIRGLSLDAAEVHRGGLAGDRRWVLADEKGSALTGREIGRLVQVVPSSDGNGHFVLTGPAGQQLTLPGTPTEGEPVSVRVWGDEVRGIAPSGEASRWFSEIASQDVKLVYMPESELRAVGGATSTKGGSMEVVSFADAFPLLLIGEASLDALNQRAGQPFEMARFRPNVVITGTSAHAEDDWKGLRIGDVEFEVASTCERCAFTTIHPHDGGRHPQSEPLRTLATYRRQPDGGVHFGVNLVPRGRGTIRIGDPVELA